MTGWVRVLIGMFGTWLGSLFLSRPRCLDLFVIIHWVTSYLTGVPSFLWASPFCMLMYSFISFLFQWKFGIFINIYIYIYIFFWHSSWMLGNLLVYIGTLLFHFGGCVDYNACHGIHWMCDVCLFNLFPVLLPGFYIMLLEHSCDIVSLFINLSWIHLQRHTSFMLNSFSNMKLLMFLPAKLSCS